MTDDKEPIRLLEPLPPECDVPVELPDHADAVRTIDGWRASGDTLSNAMTFAMFGSEVVMALRQTSVLGLPSPVAGRLRAAMEAEEPTMVPRLTVAVVVSLARRIESLGGKICGHQLACEAFRLTQLAVSGHVRRTVRLQHPLHDYWRRLSVELLFSSHCSAFYGGREAGLRMMARVAAVDTTAAEEAMLAALSGQAAAAGGGLAS